MTALLGVLLLLASAERTEAQGTTAGLAADCAGPGPEWAEWCREVALAGQAARAGLGLLATGGAEVPGSAGTLGWRLGGVPRISLGAELAGARMPAATLTTERRAVLPGEALTASALRMSAGVGVFDGFSPVPTVGGVLSVDLVGAASFAFPPDDRGFDGTASTYGAGLRVGVLRESFTLPGASVSAVRRWGGETTVTAPAGGTGTLAPSLSFEPTITSIRATVGKDFLAVGLLAGLGWDRYGGGLRVDPGTDGAGGADPSVASTDDLVDSRFLIFGGASLNFLVLQLSAEAGWAEGLDAIPGRSPGSGHDPTGASWFGSLGARLTY